MRGGKINNSTFVSIVISTYNRVQELRGVLESIQSQTVHPCEVIIVVDKGGNYEGNLSIYKEFKNRLDEEGIILKILKNNKKNSLTVARNMGIEESKGDIVFFLDDDVILEEDYIEKILDVFINDGRKEIGGATGRLINVDLRSEILERDILRRIYSYFKNFAKKIFLLWRMGDGKVRPSGFATTPYGKNEVCYVEWTPGHNMVFRKEVLKEFKFDETLERYAYFEDLDISYRVSKKYKIVYTPHAKLFHKISKAGRLNRKEVIKALIKNHRYIHNKNFPKDLKHSLAFSWSHYIGIPVYCLIYRNIEGLKGAFIGLHEEFKKGD